jgi:hypothetical protein
MYLIADDEKYAGRFEIGTPLETMPEPALRVSDP